MEQKIQELTAKIYKEGVEKGAAEAQALLADAQKKAAAILADAKSAAEKIVADAEKQVAELKRNTEAEIRLSGSQAISSVKQQILNLVTAKVVDSNLTTLLSDPATLKEFVLAAIKAWAPGGSAPALEILLPAAQQQTLTKSFESSIAAKFREGVTITFSKQIKAGFQIGPANGSYKISMTDEDFAEFFKEYLRPKTRTWLFGE